MVTYVVLCAGGDSAITCLHHACVKMISVSFEYHITSIPSCLSTTLLGWAGPKSAGFVTYLGSTSLLLLRIYCSNAAVVHVAGSWSEWVNSGSAKMWTEKTATGCCVNVGVPDLCNSQFSSSRAWNSLSIILCRTPLISSFVSFPSLHKYKKLLWQRKPKEAVDCNWK